MTCLSLHHLAPRTPGLPAREKEAPALYFGGGVLVCTVADSQRSRMPLVWSKRGPTAIRCLGNICLDGSTGPSVVIFPVPECVIEIGRRNGWQDDHVDLCSEGRHGRKGQVEGLECPLPARA